MTGFDPIASSRAAREGRLYPPREDDLGRFGKHGLWRAGREALRIVIEAWWVGEQSSVSGILTKAKQWLEARDDDGLPWGDPPIFYEAEHRHARALAGWMAGHEKEQFWREAVEAYDRLEAQAEEAFGERSALARFLCAGMAGQKIEPPADGFLVQRAGDDPHAAGPGHVLAQWIDRLIGEGPDLVIATLCAFFIGRAGNVSNPAMTFAVAQVMAPQMPLAPAYRERGWQDSNEAEASAGKLSVGALDRLLPVLGLTRDRDSTPQPDPPELATWTRHPTLDLELDWHSAGDQARLEARGAMAGRLVAALTELGGSEVSRGRSAVLADLLTVPPGSRDRANAQLRWETLAAVLRAPEAERSLTAALVEAGLSDPDWRVRMLAVWGVGSLRFGNLAEQARSAALPSLQAKGISQADRATLLGLRDAAWQRASGIAPERPTNPWAGPAGVRRAEFVARMVRLFSEADLERRDRHAALIAVLRRDPAIDRAHLPHGWSHWSP